MIVGNWAQLIAYNFHDFPFLDFLDPFYPIFRKRRNVLRGIGWFVFKVIVWNYSEFVAGHIFLSCNDERAARNGAVRVVDSVGNTITGARMRREVKRTAVAGLPLAA